MHNDSTDYYSGHFKPLGQITNRPSIKLTYLPKEDEVQVLKQQLKAERDKNRQQLQLQQLQAQESLKQLNILRSGLNDMTCRCEEVKEEYEALEVKYRSLSHSYQQLHIQMQKIKQKSHQTALIEEDNASLRSDNQQLQRENKQIQANYSLLEYQIKERVKLIQSKQELINALNQTVSFKQILIEQNQKEIREKQKTIKGYQETALQHRFIIEQQQKQIQWQKQEEYDRVAEKCEELIVENQRIIQAFTQYRNKHEMTKQEFGFKIQQYEIRLEQMNKYYQGKENSIIKQQEKQKQQLYCRLQQIQSKMKQMEEQNANLLGNRNNQQQQISNLKQKLQNVYQKQANIWTINEIMKNHAPNKKQRKSQRNCINQTQRVKQYKIHISTAQKKTFRKDGGSIFFS